MSKLRFGICGLGFMGRSHLARLRGHPHAEVVAVCDRDPARRAGDWSDALGNLNLNQETDGRQALENVQAYAEAQELIADADVQAIVVALPTHLHAAISIAALQAGKHVLCEKPMAYHPNECNHMLAAARANGRTLMIAQCIRFWPQYVTIKRLVDEGRIGNVRFLTLRRLGLPPTYSADNWLLDSTRSGGAILDLHVHDIDFAHWLLGVPASLVARGMIGPSGSIDHVVATYTYGDGRYAQLEGGWALAAPWPFDMEISAHGERGTLGWALSRGEAVHFNRGGAATEEIACAGDALRCQMDYFVDCVREQRPVELCTPASTRISVNLSWLERRSVETGKMVPLSDRLRAGWTA